MDRSTYHQVLAFCRWAVSTTSTIFGSLGGSCLPLSRQDVHTGHAICRLRKDVTAAFAEQASAPRLALAFPAAPPGPQLDKCVTATAPGSPGWAGPQRLREDLPEEAT